MTNLQPVAAPKGKRVPDIEQARRIAFEAGQSYLKNDGYPDWWGPVADVYGMVGLALYSSSSPGGLPINEYVILPDAAKVLAEEARVDAEAFDLAKHIASSSISAGRAVPEGLKYFIANVLEDKIVAPKRPTNTAVKHWKRTTLLYRLMFELTEHCGIRPTHGTKTEHETRRRNNVIPSASQIIWEEFRRAGVPQTDAQGVRFSTETAMTIWKNKEVAKRLEGAKKRRSTKFWNLVREINEAVPDERLPSLQR